MQKKYYLERHTIGRNGVSAEVGTAYTFGLKRQPLNSLTAQMDGSDSFWTENLPQCTRPGALKEALIQPVCFNSKLI